MTAAKVNRPDNRPDEAVAPTVGVLDEPVKPGYDWKLSLKAAAKMALIAAAGVLVADQTGLTAFIVANLPPAYATLGQIVLASVFAWVRNFIVNRNRAGAVA